MKARDCNINIVIFPTLARSTILNIGFAVILSSILKNSLKVQNIFHLSLRTLTSNAIGIDSKKKKEFRGAEGREFRLGFG
jgi:hypothetical protein